MAKKENTKKETVSSPDQLNTIVKVARPPIWVLLGSIVALLIGALIWATVGKIEVKLSSGAWVDNNIAYVYIKSDSIERIKLNQEVRINGKSTTINAISDMPDEVDDEWIEAHGGRYLASFIGIKNGDFVFTLTTNSIEIENNPYFAEIVVETVSPITLIFN